MRPWQVGFEISSSLSREHTVTIQRAVPSMTFIILGTFVVAESQTTSQNKAANQTDMTKQMVELLKPGENHKLLARLAGTWEFTGKHFPSDPKEKAIEISGRCVRKPLWEGRYFLAEDTGQKLKMPWAEGREVAYKDMIIDGYDNVKRKFAP